MSKINRVLNTVGFLFQEGVNGLLTGLTFFGLVYLSDPELNKLSNQTGSQLEEYKSPNRDVVLKQIKDACAHMGALQGRLPSKNILGEEASRYVELKGMQAILECVRDLENKNFDVEVFAEKYGNFCEKIKSGIEQNKWIRHPILRNFYSSLSKKLCTPDILKKLETSNKVSVKSLKELAEYLNTEENRKKLQIVRDGKDIKSFCNSILSEVVKNEKELNALLSFLNKKYILSGFGNSYPVLNSIWLELANNAKQSGKQLETFATIDGKKIAFAKDWIGICGFDRVQKIILEKEKNFIPVILEIIQIFESENAESSEELRRVFLNIFKRINKM